MAIFSAGSLNRSGGSGDNSAIYNMQLQQMETLLSKDHVLSPADNQKLAAMARGFAAKMSKASQAAPFLSKAAVYENSIANSKDTYVPDIKKELDDQSLVNGMQLTNSPRAYVEATIQTLTALRNQVGEYLTDARNVGSINEQTYSDEYNNILDELDKWETTVDDKGELVPGTLWAYATTDANGDIKNFEYAPKIATPKHIKNSTKTDLMIDGKIPVSVVPISEMSGMVKTKFLGRELASTGQATFSVDPTTNTLISTQAPLMSKGDKNIKSGDINVKRYIGNGEFALGTDKKTIYGRKDGKYQKYVNFSPKQLGVNSDNMLQLPKSWEDNIGSLVREEIDGNNLPTPSNGLPPPSLQVVSSPQGSAVSGLDLQGGQPNIPKANSSSARALQQPQGVELQQQNTEAITKGGLFNKIISAGKSIFNRR